MTVPPLRVRSATQRTAGTAPTRNRVHDDVSSFFLLSNSFQCKDGKKKDNRRNDPE